MIRLVDVTIAGSVVRNIIRSCVRLLTQKM